MATDFAKLDELLDVGGAIPLAAMRDLTVAERGELERRWASSRPQRTEAQAVVSAAPVVPAASPRSVEAKPASSEADVQAAVTYLAERRRELGLEPSHDKRPALPVGDLEADIVNRWKTDPAVRQEFRALEIYSSFRFGVRDGRIRGYDSNGEKLDRRDPIALAILAGDSEDREAGCDFRQPVSVRARQVWKLNPKVRAEFGDVEERYVAARIHAERSRRS